MLWFPVKLRVAEPSQGPRVRPQGLDARTRKKQPAGLFHCFPFPFPLALLKSKWQIQPHSSQRPQVASLTRAPMSVTPSSPRPALPPIAARVVGGAARSVGPGAAAFSLHASHVQAAQTARFGRCVRSAHRHPVRPGRLDVPLETGRRHHGTPGLPARLAATRARPEPPATFCVHKPFPPSFALRLAVLCVLPLLPHVSQAHLSQTEHITPRWSLETVAHSPRGRRAPGRDGQPGEARHPSWKPGCPGFPTRPPLISPAPGQEARMFSQSLISQAKLYRVALDPRTPAAGTFAARHLARKYVPTGNLAVFFPCPHF